MEPPKLELTLKPWKSIDELLDELTHALGVTLTQEEREIALKMFTKDRKSWAYVFYFLWALKKKLKSEIEAKELAAKIAEEFRAREIAASQEAVPLTVKRQPGDLAGIAEKLVSFRNPFGKPTDPPEGTTNRPK